MPKLTFRDQTLFQRSRLESILSEKGITLKESPKDENSKRRKRRRFPKKGESILDERAEADPEVDAFFITIFLFIAVFGFLLASVYVAPHWVSWLTGLKLVQRIPNPQVPEGISFSEAP
jgi:hypothetical protein